MAHHWIRDDDRFTATEKWVMTVIESWQFNGHMTGVAQSVIARGCSLSIRAVQKAVQSIERKGYPIVARRSSKGDATHYLVRQRQKLMFSRSNSPDLGDVRSRPGTQPSEARPVQNLVQNHPNQAVITARNHAPYEPRSPESPPHTNDVRTLSEGSSETTNSKPRAEVRPESHAPVQNHKPKTAKQRILEHVELRKEEADRRKIEARERRQDNVPGEVASAPSKGPKGAGFLELASNLTSSGSFESVERNRLLGRIAVATVEPMPIVRPPTEAQLSERLRALREQARKLGVA